jgi:hypothetical protein
VQQKVGDVPSFVRVAIHSGSVSGAFIVTIRFSVTDHLWTVSALAVEMVIATVNRAGTTYFNIVFAP